LTPRKPKPAEPTSWIFVEEKIPVQVSKTDEGFKIVCAFLPRAKTVPSYDEAVAEVPVVAHLAATALDTQMKVEEWMDAPDESETPTP
jgi:hypothetical protein